MLLLQPVYCTSVYVQYLQVPCYDVCGCPTSANVHNDGVARADLI
jgi:hypothetical protein